MNGDPRSAVPVDSLYWLETAWHDLLCGARVLRRAPRFTVAVVLVLLRFRPLFPDRRDSHPGRDVALVGRELADRLWPSGAAVGKRFRMPGMPCVPSLNDGDWLIAVGVAGSAYVNGFDLDRPDPYEIYLPWSREADIQGRPRFVLVRTVPGAEPVPSSTTGTPGPVQETGEAWPS